jgi:hypothetical protein
MRREENDGTTETPPGWVCPFCHTDASPLAPSPACPHLFAVDGENGWRFSLPARVLFDAAERRNPVLFRELLYHDAACRARLRLRRAVYDDSLEVYVWTEDAGETVRAFEAAISAASA